MRRSAPVLFALLTLVGWVQSASAASSHVVRLQSEPLFEANKGQYDAAVLYRARLPGLDAALHADASVSVFPRATRSAQLQRAIRISIAGAREVSPRAEEQAEFRANYFRGDSAPVVDVPHYRRITFPAAYPGIDISYYAAEGRLEFDFIVAAGAKPDAIALKVEGADDMRIDESGDLSIERAGAALLHRRPMAYQTVDGRRNVVACEYRLADDRTVTLALGSYDTSRELVIDPVVEYSSYLGGTVDDWVNGVAMSSDGYIYATGATWSTDFPMVNAIDSTRSQNTDAFVAKINPATGRIVWSTYIGGSDNDEGDRLAVDSSGVYVMGITSGSRFPTTTGAYRTSGSFGGVALKINAAGNALSYSTYLPSATPRAITVDAQGQAIIVGSAGSAFTTTAGSLQPAFGGTDSAFGLGDAFVLKLNAAGSALVFGTFFGGAGADEAQGVALDNLGRIAIAGNTTSNNLPTLSPYQAARAGNQDGFVSLISADGKTLLSSTYFGGADRDQVRGLAVDPFGNVVITGMTSSMNLPAVNARIPSSRLTVRWFSTTKGFVAKLSASTLQPMFSTYTGVTENCCDDNYAVGVDAVGDIYFMGETLASNLNSFELRSSFLPSQYASSKAAAAGSSASVMFASSISRDGQTLRYQSIVAPCNAVNGTSCDRGSLFAGKPGQVVIAGASNADWLPAAAMNTQPKLQGGSDGWIMTLTMENAPLELTIAPATYNSTTPVPLTATSYVPGANGVVTFSDGGVSIGTATLSQGVATISAMFPVGIRRLTATLGTTTTPATLLPVPPQAAQCP